MQLAQMSNLRFVVFDLQIYHEASTPENFAAVCRFSKFSAAASLVPKATVLPCHAMPCKMIYTAKALDLPSRVLLSVPRTLDRRVVHEAAELRTVRHQSKSPASQSNETRIFDRTVGFPKGRQQNIRTQKIN